MNAIIQTHNQKPAAVWSSGGAAYEEISRQIASALAHCVVRLDPKAGERILDVATGTGWTSRLVAERGAIVTGVDIAAELLAAARMKAQRTFALDYQIGDAEALPFQDGAFDAVSSTFGVMFASRPEAAAGEMARVTRKGGRIALATWKPDSTVFQMFQVMRAYMPPPPTPAPASPFAWGGRERVTRTPRQGLRPRLRGGRDDLLRPGRRGGVGRLRQRLRADEDARRRPRPGEARGAPPRFRRLPRHLQVAARHRHAAPVPDHGRRPALSRGRPAGKRPAGWIGLERVIG